MLYALVDFGSTFTKLALVDGRGKLLATSQALTTVETDVADGYDRALAKAARTAHVGASHVDCVLAASSAAGGLRMAAVGLVDDLTASAAKRAALSAGAKVEAIWSGRVDAEHQRAIARLAPDVILFAGGTDGGERDRVLASARAVAGAGSNADVVVACNTAISAEVGAEFQNRGHHVVVVDNVLPVVDRENSAPAQDAIRTLFIERVVRAKGISTSAEFLDSLVMPTPAAVLACAELMAGDDEGDGDQALPVLVVDVGGATTDVHSVIASNVQDSRIARSGPPPARSARTVEGDLGVRWNADSVYLLDGDWLRSEAGMDDDRVSRSVAARKADPAFIPGSDSERRLDRLLASSCVSAGLARHVGRMSTRYIPDEGADVTLTGRDLRDTRVVVVTGGSIVRGGADAVGLVEQALARLDDSRPAPGDPRIVIDENYVLASVGLLATVDQDAARELLLGQVPGLAQALGRTAAGAQPR